mmetsp:Transcript_2569/g.7635  ORF Transcript_2569/g.7635 Transcript_2569/m.7635 type:complete len:326 (-) Transcript_2569:617-1594(-)
MRRVQASDGQGPEAAGPVPLPRGAGPRVAELGRAGRGSLLRGRQDLARGRFGHGGRGGRRARPRAAQEEAAAVAGARLAAAAPPHQSADGAAADGRHVRSQTGSHARGGAGAPRRLWAQEAAGLRRRRKARRGRPGDAAPRQGVAEGRRALRADGRRGRGRRAVHVRLGQARRESQRRRAVAGRGRRARAHSTLRRGVLGRGADSRSDARRGLRQGPLGDGRRVGLFAPVAVSVVRDREADAAAARRGEAAAVAGFRSRLTRALARADGRPLGAAIRLHGRKGDALAAARRPGRPRPRHRAAHRHEGSDLSAPRRRGVGRRHVRL